MNPGLRRTMMAANWKMNKTAAETADFFSKLKALVPAGTACSVVVAPPFLSVPAAVEAARGTSIGIAGQNLHWEAKGAFTGEVSGPMLVAAGCSHVIVGHSERRQLFGESDGSVQRKVRAALGVGLTPIICVGETQQEYDAGETENVLLRQYEAAFSVLDADQLAHCVLAYEPVWAIGTGKIATPEQAQNAHMFLRGCVAGRFGSQAADSLTILYGGSIKPDNSQQLMAQPDVDGGLVGGASLEPESFAKLVAAAS